jgi:5,10-methylenetetrahydromethanopterin reductase
MANDRFGLSWGMAGGTVLASIAEARAAARLAEEIGFEHFWISHAAGVDSLAALACLGGDFPGLREVGTSVVPLYGRHPLALAQLARTAQNALGGRLTLGIGTGNQGFVEGKLGLAWGKPYTYAREFIDALAPLLDGKPADATGSLVSAHGELGIEAAPTPILLAALGPRMLRFAGARLQGTTLGQCGPRTISSYILPHLREGAEAAGRETPPRVLALVRICVTDDVAGAKALAREISARYQAIPSYAEATKHEGLDDPSDLHLIGGWPQILDGLAAYGEAGATDLRVQVAAHDAKSRDASHEALADYLS